MVSPRAVSASGSPSFRPSGASSEGPFNAQQFALFRQLANSVSDEEPESPLIRRNYVPTADHTPHNNAIEQDATQPRTGLPPNASSGSSFATEAGHLPEQRAPSTSELNPELNLACASEIIEASNEGVQTVEGQTQSPGSPGSREQSSPQPATETSSNRPPGRSGRKNALKNLGSRLLSRRSSVAIQPEKDNNKIYTKFNFINQEIETADSQLEILINKLNKDLESDKLNPDEEHERQKPITLLKKKKDLLVETSILYYDKLFKIYPKEIKKISTQEKLQPIIKELSIVNRKEYMLKKGQDELIQELNNDQDELLKIYLCDTNLPHKNNIISDILAPENALGSGLID